MCLKCRNWSKIEMDLKWTCNGPKTDLNWTKKGPKIKVLFNLSQNKIFV